MLRAAGDVLIVLTAAIADARVLVHAMARWWTTPTGRHLMAEMSVIALVLDLAAVRVFFGDASWFQVVRLLVFMLVPLVLSAGLVLQIRAHRANRRAR